MTEIDAVNRMLRYIEELPIPIDVAIDDLPEGHEAVQARVILSETNREEQESNYWFNMFNVTYKPNDSGYISMPNNVISLIGDDDYRVEGNDLYDVDNKTKLFTEDVDLDVLLEVDFTDLPSVFQTYVVLKAAQELHVYLNGDKATQDKLERALSRQFLKVDKENMRHKKINLIKGTRLIDRGSNPQPLA